MRIADLPGPEELGWSPQPMVRWLSPSGLSTTSAQLLLSGIFGAYADKREIQAALKEPSGIDLSNRPGLTLDFMADTGDGFNPTYAVARALAEPHLTVADGAQELRLPRGQVLVLGGDIAYPAASRDEFQNRFAGPFAAAFPGLEDGQERPLLLSVAGNHDWLDGLTTFLRVFTEGNNIGAWETRQSRSYFTVRLPHEWWLLCPDLALDYFIDAPQMEFFHRMVDEQVAPGSKVILAIHRPYWLVGPLHSEPFLYSPVAMSNLQRFEREIIHEKGLRMPLVLAGDIHHYDRYERSDRSQQRVVSGSGAAFIYPTHNLPDALSWPEADGVATYERRGLYPQRETSQHLQWGILAGPWKNPSFMIFVGAIYVMFGLLVRFGVAAGTGYGFRDAMLGLSRQDVAQVLFNNPLTFILVGVLGGSLIVFADQNTWPRRVLIGGLHAAVHLFLITLLVWQVGRWVPNWRPILYAMAFGALVLALGGMLGGQLFGVYLFLMQRLFRKHPTHSFSSQRIEDYRSFLRIRFEDDGSLTVFPIGMRKVPRHWRYVGPRGPSEPRIEPVDRQLECQLIEAPIRIDPDHQAQPREA